MQREGEKMKLILIGLFALLVLIILFLIGAGKLNAEYDRTMREALDEARKR